MKVTAPCLMKPHMLPKLARKGVEEARESLFFQFKATLDTERGGMRSNHHSLNDLSQSGEVGQLLHNRSCSARPHRWK